MPLHDCKKFLKDNEVIAEIAAAADYALSRPDLDRSRFFIAGHCMGGRLSFLGAATKPVFTACVAYYGGGMMTHWGEGTPTPFELIKNIRCPVYGFFGDLDTNPSPADVNRFEAELKQYGIPHVFHRYPKAGHGFQNPARAQGAQRRRNRDRGVGLGDDAGIDARGGRHPRPCDGPSRLADPAAHTTAAFSAFHQRCGGADRRQQRHDLFCERFQTRPASDENSSRNKFHADFFILPHPLGNQVGCADEAGAETARRGGRDAITLAVELKLVGARLRFGKGIGATDMRADAKRQRPAELLGALCQIGNILANDREAFLETAIIRPDS